MGILILIGIYLAAFSYLNDDTNMALIWTILVTWFSYRLFQGVTFDARKHHQAYKAILKEGHQEAPVEKFENDVGLEINAETQTLVVHYVDNCFLVLFSEIRALKVNKNILSFHTTNPDIPIVEVSSEDIDKLRELKTRLKELSGRY